MWWLKGKLLKKQDEKAGAASVGAGPTPYKDLLVTQSFGQRRMKVPGPPVDGNWDAVQRIIDSDGIEWICTESGVPGKWTRTQTPPPLPNDPALCYDGTGKWSTKGGGGANAFAQVSDGTRTAQAVGEDRLTVAAEGIATVRVDAAAKKLIIGAMHVPDPGYAHVSDGTQVANAGPDDTLTVAGGGATTVAVDPLAKRLTVTTPPPAQVNAYGHVSDGVNIANADGDATLTVAGEGTTAVLVDAVARKLTITSTQTDAPAFTSVTDGSNAYPAKVKDVLNLRGEGATTVSVDKATGQVTVSSTSEGKPKALAHISDGTRTYDAKIDDTLALRAKGVATVEVDQATGTVTIGASGGTVPSFAHMTDGTNTYNAKVDDTFMLTAGTGIKVQVSKDVGMAQISSTIVSGVDASFATVTDGKTSAVAAGKDTLTVAAEGNASVRVDTATKKLIIGAGSANPTKALAHISDGTHTYDAKLDDTLQLRATGASTVAVDATSGVVTVDTKVPPTVNAFGHLTDGTNTANASGDDKITVAGKGAATVRVDAAAKKLIISTSGGGGAGLRSVKVGTKTWKSPDEGTLEVVQGNNVTLTLDTIGGSLKIDSAGGGGSTMTTCLNDTQDADLKKLGANAERVAFAEMNAIRDVGVKVDNLKTDQVKNASTIVAGASAKDADETVMAAATRVRKLSEALDDTGIFDPPKANAAVAMKAVSDREIDDVDTLDAEIDAVDARIDALKASSLPDDSAWGGGTRNIAQAIDAIKAILDSLGGSIGKVKVGADEFQFGKNGTLELGALGTAYLHLDKATGKVDVGSSGSEQFVYYEKTLQMKYGDTLIISEKQIPELKGMHYLAIIKEEEYLGANIWNLAFQGGADNPSSEYYIWSYETTETGPDGKVLTELRIERLTGREDVAAGINLGLLFYTGQLHEIPEGLVKRDLGRVQVRPGPARVLAAPAAHIFGATNIISEFGDHDYGELIRTGDDYELLDSPAIPAAWRVLDASVPAVKLLKTGATADTARTIKAVLKPPFVRGYPVIRCMYTNPAGVKPNGIFAAQVGLVYVTHKDDKKLTDYVVKDYPDLTVNWAGTKDTLGWFELEWPDIVDCRDRSETKDRGVLSLFVRIIPNAPNTETFDAIALKYSIMAVIEKEL